MQLEFDAVNSATKASQGKLVLNTNSESDLTNASSPKGDGNFTINLAMPISGSPTASFGFITEVVDGVSYFKVNNIAINGAALPAGYSYNISEK